MFSRRLCIPVIFLSFLLGFAAIMPSMVSAASTSIVNPKQVYTYAQMTKDIEALAAAYPNLIRYESIGKTAFGRDIWAVALGNGEATIFINGSHHAREWLTTTLNLYMLEQYAQAYISDGQIGKYSARQSLNETTIWFVPMVNPDGVTLQQLGASAFPQSVRTRLIQMNGGSANFDRWKANAKGVDLNRQYDADWAHIQKAVSYPNFMNYKGTAPEQAEETKALVAFTQRIDPEIAVSYHTAGSILYWNFHTQKANLSRDQRLARTFSSITGYSLVAPSSNPSGGGYTDWFIQTYGRPAFTPELGTKTGETNLPISAFSSEWRKNKTIGLWLADEGYKLWYQKNKNNRVVQDYAASFNITETKRAYSQNNFLSQASIQISPQTLQSIRRSGNWFLIQTYAGPKWIYEAHPQIGPAETVDVYLDLQDKVSLYASPLDHTSETLLPPQEVHAIKRWKSWYLVEVQTGTKWVNLTNLSFRELTPMNQNLTLSQPVSLYDEPDGKVILEISEVPQDVTAIRQWKNWVEVQLPNQQTGWVQLEL
ncbi:Gamma-D-glutamyl-L-diamino acid endopeptidase 1 [compost metagenome]